MLGLDKAQEVADLVLRKSSFFIDIIGNVFFIFFGRCFLLNFTKAIISLLRHISDIEFVVFIAEKDAEFARISGGDLIFLLGFNGIVFFSLVVGDTVANKITK